MALQRPIVFYETLMHTYDQQVAELLAAKTDYILLADRETEIVKTLSAKQPIVVEVLQPHQSKKVKKSSTSKTKTSVNHAKTSVDPKMIKTGLGLSLDDILSEEDSVAARDRNGYFNS